jgi:hypothetical protein
MGQALRKAIVEVNGHGGSGLGFMKDREKGDFRNLIGQEVVIEDIAFARSKYNDGAENAIFTITTDPKHFFRTGSTVVIEGLKKFQKALQEDGEDWNTVGIVFTEVTGKDQTYYKVEARDFTED